MGGGFFFPRDSRDVCFFDLFSVEGAIAGVSECLVEPVVLWGCFLFETDGGAGEFEVSWPEGVKVGLHVVKGDVRGGFPAIDN